MTAAGEPDNVTEPVPLLMMVTPGVAMADSEPCGTLSVVVTTAPLSISAMMIWLPLAPENVIAISSVPFCASGSTWVGASLTGSTVTVTEVVSVTPPDVTV